jgi:hypothetical protein
MSINAETLGGAFAQKFSSGVEKAKFLGYKAIARSGIYSSKIKGEARPTQYPTSWGQWDSDEFGMI